MTINLFLDKMALCMDESFKKKCGEIVSIFSPLSPSERYQQLMDMGKRLSTYPPLLKTADRIVPGCQSLLYLSATLKGGKVYFEACADALISAGLAALLVSVYSGEAPETILKCPPAFIAELGLASSLSPSRSNGLAQIHLRMKQEALKFLI